MIDYAYSGAELDLFRHAIRWKRYFASELGPYISGEVLEVGAGIGATARFLCEARHSSWTSLEPDARLARRLTEDVAAHPLPAPMVVREGTIRTLPVRSLFDTVLYIDVLEHVEDDGEELRESAVRLREGGQLIVLAPAHHWLFSPFDEAIGHFRRYSRRSLVAIGPSNLQLVRAFYLDSLGLFVSLANRLALRARYPTEAQIRVWDRMIPISRLLDRLTGQRLGKTVVAIWKRG
jgi:SAM-dependent methyltransferase